jgi:hypothetical protein
MSVRTGAVARVSRSMAMEPAQALDAKRAQLGYDQLQEVDQQLQIEISGSATAVATSVTGPVKFDIGFVDATEQRYSAYTVPLFTSGVALLSVGTMADGSEPPAIPMVTVAVREWRERPGPVINGCVVTVTAAIPGLPPQESIDFSGYVHINAQGYGALEENEPDLDA